MLLIQAALGISILVNLTMVTVALLRLRRAKRVHHALSLTERAVHNSVAGRAAQREIARKLNVWNQKVDKRRNEHLEMFAAAYIKHSSLAPDKVELVQEIIGHEKVVWYFQPKAETKSG
jgi:site-specific recombinase XerC